MSIDRIIDQLLEEQPLVYAPSSLQLLVSDTSGKQDQLAAKAIAEQAWRYLGRALTPEQIDAIPGDESGKLYLRYEIRLRVAQAHLLGKGVRAASQYVPSKD